MAIRGEQIQADVLTTLLAHGKPLSAYGLLNDMRAAYPKIAPPTIYRALTALIKRGKVHRLESLNAFMACQREHPHKAAVLSICESCGAVEETAAQGLVDQLTQMTQKSGFSAMRHVIEVLGHCAACGAKGAKA